MVHAVWLGHAKLQQSHHCGIETVWWLGSGLARLRSNRTIVGLKHDGNRFFAVEPDGAQQSHHCGIETRLASFVVV